MNEEVTETQGIPETEEGTLLYDKAIVSLYDKNFSKAVKMLENLPPEELSAKMSLIVNTILQKIEAGRGSDLKVELAAEVGFRLFVAISEDFEADGIIEPMSEQQVMESIANIINDYALTHPKTVSHQDLKQFLTHISGQEIDLPQMGSAATGAQQAPPPGMPPQQPQPQGMLQ